MCNHCFSGKAIGITYTECVFVALGIEHVMRVSSIIYHLWPAWYDRSCQKKISYLKRIRSVIVQQQKLQENFTRQYRATIQRAIPVEKHNYPYQIGKIEVPQHQP